MTSKKVSIKDRLALIGLWLVLAAASGFALLQLHTTAVFLALRVVQNPALRPTQWNTYTISGLSRLLFLVIGAIWLMFVTFLPSYLAELRQKRRWVMGGRILLALVLLYALCYGVLILFPG